MNPNNRYEQSLRLKAIFITSLTILLGLSVYYAATAMDFTVLAKVPYLGSALMFIASFMLLHNSLKHKNALDKLKEGYEGYGLATVVLTTLLAFFLFTHFEDAESTAFPIAIISSLLTLSIRSLYNSLTEYMTWTAQPAKSADYV